MTHSASVMTHCSYLPIDESIKTRKNDEIKTKCFRQLNTPIN